MSARTHTTAFWNLLHTLLFEAEAKGIYTNPFESIEEFRALTRRIREKFLSESGALMKELGRLLVEAHELCEKHGTSFSGLPGPGARAAAHERPGHHEGAHPRPGSRGRLREHALARLHPGRTLAGRAQEELRDGHSPDMVKAAYISPKPPRSRREALQEERERIEKSIERLKKRLKEIEKRIAETGEE